MGANKQGNLPKQLFFKSRDGLGYISAPPRSQYSNFYSGSSSAYDREAVLSVRDEDPMRDADSYYSLHRTYAQPQLATYQTTSRQLDSSYIVDEDGSIVKVA